ncbi:hypothetical protein [Arthrobacter methylotrophus]|uniref:hypothetical protein n=1 Tax=Arthrobacter methylotrophus TaxID=121291 RepID=UPI0031E6393A
MENFAKSTPERAPVATASGAGMLAGGGIDLMQACPEPFLEGFLHDSVDGPGVVNEIDDIGRPSDVDLVRRNHVEQIFRRREVRLGGVHHRPRPAPHFIFLGAGAPRAPHDAASAVERDHAVLPGNLAWRLVGRGSRQGPGEGLREPSQRLLVRQRQVLEMLRQEKGTPFNDQDPCVRIDRQCPLSKGVGAEPAADDYVVELFFFADFFPFSLGDEEDMIHHLLG